MFTAVFTLELLVKVVALGVRGHHTAYLADRWNWLDAFIVFMGYLALSPAVLPM